MAEEQLEKTNEALKQYYARFDKLQDYLKTDPQGLFLHVVENDEFDLEGVTDEFEGDYHNCTFVDEFAGNMPFDDDDGDNDEDTLNKKMFFVLKYCFVNGKAPTKQAIAQGNYNGNDNDDNKIEHKEQNDISNKHPKKKPKMTVNLTLNSSFFVVSEADVVETRAFYSKQCAHFISGTRYEDNDLIKVLCIGKRNYFPFLQNICDLFARDCIGYMFKYGGFKPSEVKKVKQLDLHSWAQKSPYFEEISKFKSGSNRPTHIVFNAIREFYHRVAPKIQLRPLTRVIDDLQEIAQYIQSISMFINNLVHRSELICPFQADCSIAVRNVTMGRSFVVHVTSENFADYDHDDDVDSDEQDDTAGKYYDCVGNLPNRLARNKCKYVTKPVTSVNNSSKPLKGGDAFRSSRLIEKAFSEFIAEQKSDKKNGEDYPRKRRFCVFVDRRHDKTTDFKSNDKKVNKIFPVTVSDDDIDQITVFDPPDKCNAFGMNGVPTVPEKYFDQIKSCLIPGEGDDCYEMDSTEQLRLRTININARHTCNGGLLTFSFHVESEDCIKCYLYLNGQIIRFLPQDVYKLLPGLFDFTEENLKFAESAKAREIASQIKIKDDDFESFYRKYGLFPDQN